MNGFLSNNGCNDFSPLIMGDTKYLSILAYDVQYVGPSVWPRNWDKWSLYDKTPM